MSSLPMRWTIETTNSGPVGNSVSSRSCNHTIPHKISIAACTDSPPLCDSQTADWTSSAFKSQATSSTHLSQFTPSRSAQWEDRLVHRLNF
eukprot:748790-Hanusia_phi.AAC.1